MKGEQVPIRSQHDHEQVERVAPTMAVMQHYKHIGFLCGSLSANTHASSKGRPSSR